MHSCNTWLDFKNKQEEPRKDVNTGSFWVEGLWVIVFVSYSLSGFSYSQHVLPVQLETSFYSEGGAIDGILHKDILERLLQQSIGHSFLPSRIL